MTTNVCPTCGHKRTAPRAPRASALPERQEIDRAFADRTLTKDQYFAQCKRIAVRDDVRFFLRVTSGTLPEALHTEALALLAEVERRAAQRQDTATLNRIRDRYRMSKGSLIVYRASYREESAA